MRANWGRGRRSDGARAGLGGRGRRASPGGRRRRSLSSSAQGPSWLGVQLRLEHTEDTPGHHQPPPSALRVHTLPPPPGPTSHEDTVPDGDGHALVGLGTDKRHKEPAPTSAPPEHGWFPGDAQRVCAPSQPISNPPCPSSDTSADSVGPQLQPLLTPFTATASTMATSVAHLDYSALSGWSRPLYTPRGHHGRWVLAHRAAYNLTPAHPLTSCCALSSYPLRSSPRPHCATHRAALRAFAPAGTSTWTTCA